MVNAPYGDDLPTGGVHSAATDATVVAPSNPVSEFLCDLPPDAFRGYQVIRELHRGGQGIVFQAVQKSTGRKVAIKLMREGPLATPAERARFEREVQVLGQLNHAGIVAIHDTGRVAGFDYYVMDYVSGESLSAFIAAQHEDSALAARGGGRPPEPSQPVYDSAARHLSGSGRRLDERWPVDDTLRLFLRICDAVNAAHLRGVIHRDLKPGNIRLDENGEPRVLDFGLAKIAVGTSDAAVMTMTGEFVGSLPWASPEQASGAASRIDVRTDVYSLGVILYQMLTGRLPFQPADDMRETLERISTAPPARPRLVRREIDDEVETIVLKCLAKERERRYQNAGEVARDIERYLTGLPIEAKRDSMSYLLHKQLRRHRAAFGAAAVALLLLVAALVTAVMGWRAAEANAALAQKEAARAAEEKQKVAGINEFLQQMLSKVDASGSRDGGIGFRTLLDEAVRKLQAGAIPKQPEIEASVRFAIGDGYRSLGLFKEATPHLMRALDLRRQLFGEENLQTAAAANSVAMLQTETGEFAAAEPLIRSVIDVRRRLLGADDTEVADSLHNLAALLWNSRRFTEALEASNAAVVIDRRHYGDLHANVLLGEANAAVLTRDLGRLTEAEAALRRAIEKHRSVFGEEDWRTANTHYHLAVCLQREHQVGEALEQAERARRILLSAFGPDHFRVKRTDVLLGELRATASRPADAREPPQDEKPAGRERARQSTASGS